MQRFYTTSFNIRSIIEMFHPEVLDSLCSEPNSLFK